MATSSNSKVPDTSRISITAHYTGYVWFENGLSTPQLATSLGRIGYHTLQPIMSSLGRLTGISTLEDILLQRHHIIDHLLRKSIESQGVRQIVELACGLSPRGLRFMEKYGHLGLKYLEADLPGMVKRKQQVYGLSEIYQHPNHQLTTCNILGGQASFQQLLDQHLDSKIPIIIITEGLINYFPLKTMMQVWKDLSEFLKNFPKGGYVTDNFPPPTSSKFYPLIQLMRRGIEVVGRGGVSLHFETIEDAQQIFQEAGFQQLEVHLPETYYPQLPIPQSQTPSLIQVLEAWV